MQQIKTVLVFTKLSTRRFFRDRLAIFFTILFPLIFLFVFGSLTKNSGSPTFHVVVLNDSHTAFSQTFDAEIKQSKTFSVSKTINDLADAKDSLSKSQIDGI